MLNYQYDPKSWNQQINLVTPVATADAIVTADTYTAGALPLNGSMVTLVGATMPTVEKLRITSAGDDSSCLFTVYGFNSNNEIIVDSFLGANVGAAASTLFFKAIISITPSQDTAANVIAGDGAVNNGVCLSQAGDANKALLLNGSFASGEFFNLNPSFITITSAADESTNSITATIMDESGRFYTSTITLANTGTVTLELPSRMIRQGDLILENDATGNISIGIGGSGGPGGQAITATPWCSLDLKRSVDSDGLFVFVTGTLNYTVQYTNDPILGKAKGFATPPSNIVNDSTLLNQTINNRTGLNNPAVSCRLLINSASASSSALFQLIQQGDFTAAPPAI